MDVREYRLDLDVRYAECRFRGDVRMAVANAASPVALDAVGLAIENVWADDRPVPFQLDPAHEKLIVGPIPEGMTELRVAYAADLPRRILTGFYVSDFGDRHLLTTMLYPTGCRRFFPCLDEPTKKAIFRLTVRTGADVDVVSNASPQSVEEHAGGRTWVFAPTPRMSTYLLYLGIGPFDLLTGIYDSMEIISAAPPGRGSNGQFAVDHAGPIVRGFEEYYQEPYPLKKLHLIAVPEFWAGAMENWGAIAFAEGSLLVDETTSVRQRKSILLTLAHEIAHQWFGNLVTMVWWNDFWLNESFATFAGTKIVDRLGFDREAWSSFFVRWTRLAFFGDALGSTHPVEVEIRSPEEITQIADEISYGKGASLLRMIESYIGEENFRQGLAMYLKRFQYRNARGEDLWQALEEVSKEPVSRILSLWIRSPGHPVVEVRHEAGELVLQQRRFLFHGPAPEEAPWPIPLVYEADGQVSRVLFESEELRVPVADPASLRINPERTGFFRVHYSGDLYSRLLARLAQLPSLDLWAIANDASAFLLSGDLALPDYLELVRRASPRREYVTTRDIAENLAFLLPFLGEHPEFVRTYRSFFEEQIRHVSLSARPGEPDTDAMLRDRLGLLRVLGDPEFALELAPLFGEVDRVDPSMRAAVTLAAALTGNARTFDRLVVRLREAPSDTAAAETAAALGAFRSPDLVRRSLELAMSSTTRTSHALGILLGALEGRGASEMVWGWLTEQLPELERRTVGTPLLGTFLEAAIPILGIDHEAEVRAFFRDHEFSEATRGVAKGLELLEITSSLRRRVLPTAVTPMPTVPTAVR
ncbi:MAG: M1 family metallopeptidase [Thermoplasmata archaeon]